SGSWRGTVFGPCCCLLPLVLFGLGVSGAWIGNLAQLAPYQPFFIAATIACLGYGYWLVYRSSKVACAGGEACARPLSTRLVPLGVLLGTVLVISTIRFSFPPPFFFPPCTQHPPSPPS